MTSISPYYTVYAPPPPPPPPPVILDVNGNPKAPEVVVVIGQRIDPYKSLLPYKGLTGAAENARRDMAFAMAGPEDRCRMLGMDPNASVGLGAEAINEYDEISSFLPPSLQGEAARLALEAAGEELSNSIDAAKIGRAGENAVREEFLKQGWTEVGSQVRVVIFDNQGKPGVRIYDFLARNALGEYTFLEVKTNTATRSPRQLELDNNMMSNGGIIATSRLSNVGINPGTIIKPTIVDLVNVSIELRT